MDLWLPCYTQDEIAETVGLSPDAVSLQIGEHRDLASLPNLGKLAATYSEPDWTPPLYNVRN